MTHMARIYQFPDQASNDEGRHIREERSPRPRPVASRHRRRSVSNKAQDWAWTQPVRGTRQHVLLALAKRARPKSEVATPSMPELVEMTGLTENTIRAHIKALADLGVIQAERSNGGRHKRSAYTLMVNLPVDSGSPTPQEMRGSEQAETPQELSTPTPQQMDRSGPETPHLLDRNPSGDAPVVLRTKGGTRGVREATADAAAAPQPADDALFEEPVTDATVQRDRRRIGRAISERYCAIEPLSKYPAIFGVVMKALAGDRFSGEEVMAAVVQIANEGRGLTTETLRVQLMGFTPRSNGSRQTNRVPLRERLKGGAA